MLKNNTRASGPSDGAAVYPQATVASLSTKSKFGPPVRAAGWLQRWFRSGELGNASINTPTGRRRRYTVTPRHDVGPSRRRRRLVPAGDQKNKTHTHPSDRGNGSELVTRTFVCVSCGFDVCVRVYRNVCGEKACSATGPWLRFTIGGRVCVCVVRTWPRSPWISMVVGPVAASGPVDVRGTRATITR